MEQVNTKLTAIANVIRSLLGITSKMGFDAMATNLKNEQTNVTNAFTAVKNKGGTVPSSKISGNLASAINTIPIGVTVKRKTGTFSPSNGKTTVECGFQPDILYLTTGGYEKGYLMTACLAFAETTQTKINTTTWDSRDNIIEIFATRSTTGASLSFTTYDDYWDEHNYNGSFSYVAVKYT